MDYRIKPCIINIVMEFHITKGEGGIIMYDCIIAGAGIAGAVAARKLAEEKDKKVLVIECWTFLNAYHR